MEERNKLNKNGQWSLEKWNMEKRCWEGYQPTPGKKPYEKGSCEPIKKDDKPHPPESPEDSAHDVVEEGASLKDEIDSLSSQERDDMLTHLRTLKDKRKHRSETNAKAGEDVSKQELNKTDVEIAFFDDGHADIFFGEEVPDTYEKEFCSILLKKGYEEINKKEWAPKAEHKSEKGGLTAAGRKSYNKATGGNLKAPQPGGGPRKRSFCARNAGQIRMHNIDCRKDPDKRACKARRRWKCGSVKKSTEAMCDLIIESLAKRCWEGYKPVKGKKPYEKGSCEPVGKTEVAPKNSKNRKTYLKNVAKDEQ